MGSIRDQTDSGGTTAPVFRQEVETSYGSQVEVTGQEPICLDILEKSSGDLARDIWGSWGNTSLLE